MSAPTTHSAPSKLEPNFLKFYAQLSPDKRHVIDRHSELQEYKKGETVCTQGDPADSLYAIEKGVVEVVLKTEDSAIPRSVAYLSPGDIFGEMGVITGRPRISTIRVCEDVRLRKFHLQWFHFLLETIPAFGAFLVSHLTERLYRLASSHYYMSYSVDFTGNLENFDLLLIFQTLQSAGRTGELILTNASNDVLGTFFFHHGNVLHARYLHLRGLEAVWQVFIEDKLDGSFAFQAQDNNTPLPTAEDPERITLQGMDLLMQAASKRDIYQILAPSSKDLTRELSRKNSGDELNWDDPETEAAARAIWGHIRKRPQTLGTLWRLTNYSVPTIIDITRRMREKQLASLSKDGKPEET